MKKIIFGSALMICGTIASCIEYIAQRMENIAFKLPETTFLDGNLLLGLGGRILFLVGIILCLRELLSKTGSGNKNE